MTQCYTSENLTYKRCHTSDFAQLLSLHDAIFATLADATQLRRNMPEMLYSCLSEPHYTLGAWHNDILVAVSILYIPQSPAEDLSLSIPETAISLYDRRQREFSPGDNSLPFPSGITRKANNKLCLVLPRYRGHNLQLRLGWKIELEAVQRGIQLLCATASPCNAASCRSLERQGYRLCHRLIKYGYLRNLYAKFLAE